MDDTMTETLAKVKTPAITLTAGMLIAILLLAANLRATLTGVGTLLPYIERDTGLAASWGGALGALPLVTFAVTSLFVGRVSHRFGSARVLVGALTVLAIGTVVRSLPGMPFLFGGTVVLSAAIAFGNVLLPSLIRHHVPPARIHLVTSLYVTILGLTAALSSGISVPLAQVLPGSWRSSLGWGSVLAVIALLVWLPRMRGDRPAAGAGRSHSPTPWRSGLAWQVSFFMGLQSLGFYTAIAWLPSMLAHQGMSTSSAGWMLFYYQIVALAASILLPLITRGRHDQRFIASAASVIVAAGFGVLLILPGLAILACTLLGVGGGVCLVLALSFQSQRAAGAGESAALAGMAQSLGYLVAAAGPVLLGIVHEATHDWTAPLILLIVISLVMTAFGYGAGRDRHVEVAART